MEKAEKYRKVSVPRTAEGWHALTPEQREHISGRHPRDTIRNVVEFQALPEAESLVINAVLALSLDAMPMRKTFIGNIIKEVAKDPRPQAEAALTILARAVAVTEPDIYLRNESLFARVAEETRVACHKQATEPYVYTLGGNATSAEPNPDRKAELARQMGVRQVFEPNQGASR